MLSHPLGKYINHRGRYIGMWLVGKYEMLYVFIYSQK